MSLRSSSIQCGCGKVCIGIQMPFSSYGIISQTCAYCQCRDCLGFPLAVRATSSSPQAIQEHATVIENWNASCMTQFYKSDIMKLEGSEHMAGCEVRKGAMFRRYYSTCCKTPLMAWMIQGPILLLHTKHLEGSKGILKSKPTVVVNHSSAPPDSNPPTEIMVPVREGMFAPIFFLRILCRFFLGLILGKGNSSVQEVLDQVPVVIGLDAIQKKA